MATKTDDFGFISFNQQSDSRANSSSNSKNDYGFVSSPDQDSKLKSLFRTVYQPFSGALNITPYGILTGLWDIAGTSEGLNALEEDFSPERIADLQKKFPFADFSQVQSPDFREKYLKGLEEARSAIPTISNIERGLESGTGIPLEDKTDTQRILKTLGTGFRLTPGSVSQKAQGAALATGGQAGLESLGVPGAIAEPLSLVASGNVPKVSSISREVKSSGLPVRKYEGLTKERTVTQGQAKGIRDTLEKDIRDATQKLIQSESKTARALKDDASFPAKIDSLFEDVEKLASQLPDESLSTIDVLNSVRNKVRTRESKGITPSEADRTYLKEMNRLMKSLRKGGGKEVTNSKLLEQYRETNKALGQYFEPGKSKASNTGKKDALLDYNRSLADIWQDNYPDSEFNQLFKFTNKRYSELADLDVIDSHLDSIFKDNRIDYKQAQKFFKDDKIKRAFNRTLGEKGTKEVNEIFKDFIPTEQYMKLLKEANALGIKDVLKLGLKWYSLKPWAVVSGSKKGIDYVRNSLLENQKFRTEWKTSWEALKDKNFQKAATALKHMDELEEEAQEQFIR